MAGKNSGHDRATPWPFSSRIVDCLIETAEDQCDPLFAMDALGKVRVNLVRYAIIPLERYERYRELAEEMAAQMAVDALRRASEQYKESRQ